MIVGFVFLIASQTLSPVPHLHHFRRRHLHSLYRRPRYLRYLTSSLFWKDRNRTSCNVGTDVTIFDTLGGTRTSLPGRRSQRMQNTVGLCRGRANDLCRWWALSTVRIVFRHAWVCDRQQHVKIVFRYHTY